MKKKEILFLTEEEVQEKLRQQGSFEQYLDLSDVGKKLFLDFCTGQNLKLLTYDSIFKYIFYRSGDYRRLEHFLSAVLGFSVNIVEVLPTESEKLVETGSILILDVVTRAEDGSIINVEIQKRPYKFSGQRESCYISDLIMRQYNFRKNEVRLENEAIRKQEQKIGKKLPRVQFSYKRMRPVYTIILLENSYYEFLNYKEYWKHCGEMVFDTGIQLEYLPHVIYITVDNFRKIAQNVNTELEKWIYLIGADTPERILRAAGMSQEFFEIVQDVSQFCMNVEEVMNMVSEILREMDRETERLMMDEAMEELENIKIELNDAQNELSGIQNKLEGTQKELEGTQKELEGTQKELEGTQKELENTQEKLEKQSIEFAKKLFISKKFSMEEIADMSGISCEDMKKMSVGWD